MERYCWKIAKKVAEIDDKVTTKVARTEADRLNWIKNINRFISLKENKYWIENSNKLELTNKNSALRN